MFYIEKATHNHVLIASAKDNKLRAFPIDIFERSKKREPKDVKRNRKIAIINDTMHTFKQKEWKDAVKRTSYQVIRESYEIVLDGVHRACVILGSENDFVIVPVDVFKNAKVG